MDGDEMLRAIASVVKERERIAKERFQRIEHAFDELQSNNLLESPEGGVSLDGLVSEMRAIAEMFKKQNALLEKILKRELKLEVPKDAIKVQMTEPQAKSAVFHRGPNGKIESITIE